MPAESDPGVVPLDVPPSLDVELRAARTVGDQLDGERFVTGIRNAVALDWNDAEQALFFANHGRDQLSTLWPDYYDDEDSAEVLKELAKAAKKALTSNG